MDFVNKLSGGGGDNNQQSSDKKNETGSSGGGGLMDKVNEMGGGGKKGEENEDGLDKGVDLVQQYVLGQGDQSNESAAEQAKDEAISDFIRDKYKSANGSDFPIADKDKKFGV